MDLVMLVLMLAIIGAILWAITKYIPMPEMFKTVIYVVVAIALLLYLIRRFAGDLPNVL